MLKEKIRTLNGEKYRPLKSREMIEFGDLVEHEPPPNFRAGRVVHGRKVLPSEAERKMFWRKVSTCSSAG